MKYNKFYADFCVGIFALIVFIAMAFLALKAINPKSFFSGIYNKNQYNISATFNNIGSLKVNSPVKSSGFVIGNVSNIYLDEKYQAKVEMTIDARYMFPVDSSADILTNGLLGEQYISISPGHEKDMISQNGSIVFTNSAIVMEQIVSKFLNNFSSK